MTDFDPQAGLDFPVFDGRRSSLATGREVFVDAARPVNPALAEEIAGTAKWRGSYLSPTRDLVAAGLAVAGGTEAMSRAGLASLHRQFRFTRDGRVSTIADAFAEYREARLASVEVAGMGRQQHDLVIPYRGKALSGAALSHQCDLWLAAGIVEPSFAQALMAVSEHPEWLDLSGVPFAVMGAGAEMSPTTCLLDWGATVYAVDLPHPDLWRRLLAAGRERAGKLMVPVPQAERAAVAAAPDNPNRLAEVAGADLLNQAPEVRTWLSEIPGQFTLGNYVYADGAVHVRASLAIDAIAVDLLAAGHPLMLAWLATPTDVFAVGMDAVAESRRRWHDASAAATFARRPLSLLGKFAPNYPSTVWTHDGREYGLCDCLVPQQGPNYLLAKRLQRWRAVTARADGVRVSLNVAPSTRTRSVAKNRALAAAFAGAGRFGLEIFEPATSNAIMAALLVHDLRNPAAAANPQVPLAHPLDLFIQGAAHGGLWRSEFSARSVLGFAALMGMFERRA
ncbi:MAG: hypothetical protein ACOYEV_00795 [Candidatus Nanopelagicales bacterium]